MFVAWTKNGQIRKFKPAVVQRQETMSGLPPPHRASMTGGQFGPPPPIPPEPPPPGEPPPAPTFSPGSYPHSPRAASNYARQITPITSPDQPPLGRRRLNNLGCSPHYQRGSEERRERDANHDASRGFREPDADHDASASRGLASRRLHMDPP